MPLKPYRLIRTDAELASLIPRLRAAPRIALDMEADSLHHYCEKVCLLQLTAGDDDVLIDPLGGLKLGELIDVLADSRLIFHGGDYDLRMLRRSFGMRPRREVVDTMIAAQLLGFERVGLAAQVERFFGAQLSKRGQKSDWSRRPLSKEQLEYARLDAHYLPALAPILEGMLAERGRDRWLAESCAAMVHAAMQEDRAASEDAWRIKGARILSRRELSFLREIWGWREHEARRADLPRFKIIGDETILALAQWAAVHSSPLPGHGPKLPRNCVGKRLAALERATCRARALPAAAWPDHQRPERRPRSGPDCSAKIEALRAACARLAHGLGVAPSVLAPRAALIAIAQKVAALPRTGLSPEGRPLLEEIMAAGSILRWQAELLIPTIEKMLRGK